MIFELTVRNVVTKNEWCETYTRKTADIEKWAKGVVEFYNSTRHEGDPEREFVSVRLMKKVNHRWKCSGCGTWSTKKTICNSEACHKCGTILIAYPGADGMPNDTY